MGICAGVRLLKTEQLCFVAFAIIQSSTISGYHFRRGCWSGFFKRGSFAIGETSCDRRRMQVILINEIAAAPAQLSESPTSLNLLVMA